MTSSRSPGHDHERARAHVLEHVAGLHRPDRDAVDHPVEVRARMDRLAADALEDHPEGGVRQDRADRQHAEQADPVEGEAALEHLGDPGLGDEVDLVDDRPGDRHPVGGEVGRVQDDLVDRPAHATLADDDRRRAEQPGHDRVREADHRADSGMSRALDQEHVVVGAERVTGRDDPRAEVLDDLARDVLLREPARDVDRAHRGVHRRQVEHLVHEDRVLVGRLAVVDDRPLAHRLHERRAVVGLEEAVERPRAAVVLPRFWPVAAR